MNERKPNLDERWEKVMASVNVPQAEMDEDFCRQLGERTAKVFCESSVPETGKGWGRWPYVHRLPVTIGLGVTAAVVVCVTLALVATRPDGFVARSSLDTTTENQVRWAGDMQTDLPTSRWRLRRAWEESEDSLSELLDGRQLAQRSTPTEVQTAWMSRNVLYLERETEMRK